jgi:hypothetical protein
MGDYEVKKLLRERGTGEMLDDFMRHALNQKELDVPMFLDCLLDYVCRIYVDRIDDHEAAKKYIHEHVSEFLAWDEVGREVTAEEGDDEE